MKGHIYKITNLITGDCYVGQTVQLNRRRNRHFEMLRKNKHHSLILQNAYNSYGRESFKFVIIEEFTFSEKISKDYIKEYMSCQEIHYMKLIDPKYNINKVYTESSLGRKLSEEHKNNISKALKGRMPSEATLEGSRKYHTGRKFSEERLIKHRATKRGRPKTQEDKERISQEQRNFHKKLFYVWNMDGIFVGEYNNIVEVAEKLNLKHTGTISECLSGKLYKSTQGYVFSYAEKYSKNLDIGDEKNKWINEFIDKAYREISILVFDKYNNMIGEFKSLTKAAEHIGICSSGISRCLSGKKKSVKGFTFKKKEETNG